MYLEITILSIYNFLILYECLFGFFFFFYTLAPASFKSWPIPTNNNKKQLKFKSSTLVPCFKIVPILSNVSF